MTNEMIWACAEEGQGKDFKDGAEGKGHREDTWMYNVIIGICTVKIRSAVYTVQGNSYFMQNNYKKLQ